MKSLGSATIILFMLTLSLFSQNNDKKTEPVALNKEYYSKLAEIIPIKRDYFLDDELNKLFRGKGFVESVDVLQRFNRQYRIVLIDSDAVSLNIRLYIYTSNDEYLKTLQKGDLFEYKGQLVIYTPLNLARNSYIFDILLEDGTLLVK
ncbi:MAG: hypothetical protein SVZ03_11270 [Spirochaetota bacterium]|nr:hypothetical protein [Spirochaetota bacterium]